MILPCVRFVRIFDAQQLRMRNIWMRITTKDQYDNAPLATELCIQAPTVEKVLEELKGFCSRHLSDEVVQQIRESAKDITWEEARDSTFEVMNAS